MTTAVKNSSISIARNRIRSIHASLATLGERIIAFESTGFFEEAEILKQERQALTKRLSRLAQSYI